MDMDKLNHRYLQYDDLLWLGMVGDRDAGGVLPNEVFCRLVHFGLIRRTTSGYVLTPRGRRMRGEFLTRPERWRRFGDDSPETESAGCGHPFRTWQAQCGAVFEGDPEDSTTWGIH